MVLGCSLIPSLDVIADQRFNEALLVFYAVQAFDDIRVILAVEPKMILSPGALVVLCRVFRVIITHDYLPRYAISIAAAMMMIANIMSGIRPFPFVIITGFLPGHSRYCGGVLGNLRSGSG